MGYKLLGFVVWQGAKWYLRRRFPHGGRNIAIAAVAGGVIAGGIAVGLLSMVAYERWMHRATHRTDTALVDDPEAPALSIGTGGTSTATATLAPPARGLATWSTARGE